MSQNIEKGKTGCNKVIIHDTYLISCNGIREINKITINRVSIQCEIKECSLMDGCMEAHVNVLATC